MLFNFSVLKLFAPVWRLTQLGSIWQNWSECEVSLSESESNCESQVM